MNKTSKQYFQESHSKVYGAMQTFVFDISPTLSENEFEKLCSKRPEVYEKYRQWFYRSRK